jgi:hypothetical protein
VIPGAILVVGIGKCSRSRVSGLGLWRELRGSSRENVHGSRRSWEVRKDRLVARVKLGKHVAASDLGFWHPLCSDKGYPASNLYRHYPVSFRERQL